MGKITDALKKAAKDRLVHVDKIERQTQVKYEFVVKKTVESTFDPRIVTFYDQHSPVTEQYRMLRTHLTASSAAKPIKTFAVTSSIHSEGKSITSVNLAISMAQDLNGQRILLVDADLRKPKISRYLGITVDSGLTEVLSKDSPLEEALVNVGIPNLTVLPSGAIPKNPAELVGSNKMRSLIQTLKGKFDYIIFDTPPIIPVTDAGLLGALTDGVIMVVQANRTQKGVVKHGESMLRQAHAKILGYILTNIQYHIPAYIYRYL